MYICVWMFRSRVIGAKVLLQSLFEIVDSAKWNYCLFVFPLVAWYSTLYSLKWFYLLHAQLWSATYLYMDCLPWKEESLSPPLFLWLSTLKRVQKDFKEPEVVFSAAKGYLPDKTQTLHTWIDRNWDCMHKAFIWSSQQEFQLAKEKLMKSHP